MSRYLQLLSIFLVLITLAGCKQPQSINPMIEVTVSEDQATDQANPITMTLEPYTFKSSDPGMITVHGILLVMDPTVMLPDPNDAIFLVPISNAEGISTIPAFIVGEVPQADVDERTGEFVFINLQPGKYAVVVLTTGGAQIPARVYDSGNLAIFDVGDSHRDSTFELDYLRLP